MLKRTVPIAFILILFLTHTNSMIMRNNALITKMVSQFQGKDKTNENTSLEPKTETQNVVSMMQNVLCRNFPSIPCDVIMKDPTLRSLIEKSVQQIKYKKMKMMEKTTLSPNYQLTLFPVINSEDLSNFLQVSDTGFYSHKNKDKPKKKAKKSVTSKNFWSHEAQPKKKESKTEFSSRKKIRKFYPHKIKYKDKNTKKDFEDYSEEKLSMSVEVPESHTGVKRRHFSYRNQPSDPPVWRIDYMKHGEPSFNMFGYETDSLRGKIIKAGPNVIVDENVLEQAARRDVLHPDVYIKKNYVRKRASDQSEAID